MNSTCIYSNFYIPQTYTRIHNRHKYITGDHYMLIFKNTKLFTLFSKIEGRTFSLVITFILELTDMEIFSNVMTREKIGAQQ